MTAVAAITRDPIDLARLGEWMDGQGLSGGPIERAATLSGGSQNILLRFDRSGRSYVLRRPPAHPRPDSSETMRREARVLAALEGSEVPHPRLIAACSDEEVLGAAFYLMEPVDGFSAVSGPLPAPHADDASLRYAMGLALAEGAAALSRVDHHAVGLDGFGKPDGYLERQVPRWRAKLNSYARHADWPGAESLPGIEPVGAWLESYRPAPSPAGIIHGDYSIGNVMFRRDGPQIAAIVDWELATIGDPLVDLGWILATWRDPREIDIGVLRVEPFAGFPSPEELIAHYARHSRRDVSWIDWYVVLACFKLAIILEGSFARACAGLASMAVGERLHVAAARLMARALHRIERA